MTIGPLQQPPDFPNDDKDQVSGWSRAGAGGVVFIMGLSTVLILPLFIPSFFSTIKKNWHVLTTGTNKVASVAQAVLKTNPVKIADVAPQQPLTAADTSAFVRNLGRFFNQGQTLKTGLLGEEHVNVMLYQQLHRRSDVAILPTPINGQLQIPEGFIAPRYVVIALAVNNNTHNTALVVDTENNTYTYLDSQDGTCPLQILHEAEAYFLKENFKEQVFKNRTNQNDGWSCGLHVVENVVNLVNGTKPLKATRGYQDGNALYNKHKTSFLEFTRAHGLTKQDRDDIALGKRHKRTLKFALQNTSKRWPTGLEHPLNNLVKALVADQTKGGEGSFSEFIRDYEKSNPADATGIGVLQELANMPSDILEAGFAKSVDETQAISDQRQKALEAWINAKFPIPVQS